MLFGLFGSELQRISTLTLAVLDVRRYPVVLLAIRDAFPIGYIQIMNICSLTCHFWTSTHSPYSAAKQNNMTLT